MRVFFILLLVFAGPASFGQKLRFAYHGNHWITGGLTPDCVLHGNVKYDTLDTIFQGKQYLRLNGFINAFPNSASSTCGGAKILYYLIREDSTNRRVYYRDPSLDTFEHILYDYNLRVGDTIKYVRSGSTSTDSVVSIDSTLINGLWHKVWYMHNTGLGDWRIYTVVEGLGCTTNPMFPVYFFVCFEWDEKLLCFSRDTVYPAINAPYQMCVSGLDSFVNSHGCIILSANDLVKGTQTISISPNPATDHITFTTNVASTTVTINAITGNSIHKVNLENSTTINTTWWPAGLYIVTIQNESGILKREKIIITH